MVLLVNRNIGTVIDFFNMDWARSPTDSLNTQWQIQYLSINDTVQCVNSIFKTKLWSGERFRMKFMCAVRPCSFFTPVLPCAVPSKEVYDTVKVSLPSWWCTPSSSKDRLGRLVWRAPSLATPQRWSWVSLATMPACSSRSRNWHGCSNPPGTHEQYSAVAIIGDRAHRSGEGPITTK